MTTLFESDTYGNVLTVRPVGDPLPDWLWIETEDRREPENTRVRSANALNRDEIEALRDALDDWLDEHPPKPDPFANGAEVECSIGGTTFLVSRIDEKRG